MPIHRLTNNPIITPFMDRRMGRNVNGPSLIRVPDWVPDPLGRYYLYFAHHRGAYIRLAYADELAGPWKTHEPGVLAVEQSYFTEHVASPDVHIDEDTRLIRMYFHGLVSPPNNQGTRVAFSFDGLSFIVSPPLLGGPYFRVFQWGGDYYAWAMGGHFWRSSDGLEPFDKGPECGFPPKVRHGAVLLEEDKLVVLFSSIGDTPERIFASEVLLDRPWKEWRASEPKEVIRPETDYEGGNLKLEASERGEINEPVRQLRDPAVFRDGEDVYFLYSVAGENGIAIARIE